MADDSSNPYIRTYAKDVAALSGKGGSATPTGGNFPITQPKTTEVNEEEKNRAEVLARLQERARKDPVSQSEMLPRSMPTPAPIPEPIPATEIPEPVPVSPPPPPIEQPIAHASVIPQAPIAPLPVRTVEPEPLTNLPPPPPEPIKPPPAPSFVPPPEPVKPVSLDNVSPIHTYTSDFSNRIDTKNASAFSVLAAQADEGKLTTPTQSGPRKSGRGALIIAFSFVLLLLAGGGAYATYWYVSTKSVVPVVTQSIPSLVFADDRQAVTGEGTELLQTIATSANTALGDGQVRVLYLTQSSTTPDKRIVSIPLPGGRLIGALQLSAPDILLRNIAPESTVGVVHAGGETRAFFILRVLSYERTFAGMLNWEGLMASELAVLYPGYPAPTIPPPTIATTTTLIKGKKVIATTTIPAVQPIILAPHFVDEVASNHDVRALKDGQGRTILLYGYRDKETLIIARDEAAFAEISNRLSATKQQ